MVFAGRHLAAVVAGASAVALLAAGAGALRTLVSSLPSTLNLVAADPLPLDGSTTIEQSFIAPACPLTHVRVLVTRSAAAPARLSADLRTAAPGAPWPEKVVFATSVIVPASAAPDGISFDVPARPDSWRRLHVLRLQLTEGGPVTLGAGISQPMWPGRLRVNGAWLGNRALAFEAGDGTASAGALACVVGGSGRARFLLLCATLVLVLAASLAGAGLALPGRAVAVSPGARAPGWRWSSLLPPALALASGLLWVVVVPPFEGPDEVAHVQYARFIAESGRLPAEIPSVDSPWREGFYEWVQPPLHYLAGASLIRALGASSDPPHPPRLEPNPRSRVSGGPERTVYVHASAEKGELLTSLLLLRALSLMCTVVVVLASARLVCDHLRDGQLAVLAAGSLALVPQWSAALATAANDATATLAAALSSLVILRLAREPAPPWRWFVAGVLIGLALTTKLTTAFLLPMALVAVAGPVVGAGRLANAAALTAGLLAGSGWFFLHNLVAFGDPFARTFKRSVLEQSGFLALSRVQPGPLEAAFWTGLKGQVFEAFWARFGSLGAGPDAGSRVWWIYGALTLLLVGAAATGLAGVVNGLRRRTANDTETNRWPSVTLAVGVAAGLGSWVLVNLLGREDVVVHWTPRHVLPVSPLLLVLAASGLRAMRRELGGSATLWRAGGAAVVLALGLGWIVSLRFAIQHLHVGY